MVSDPVVLPHAAVRNIGPLPEIVTGVDRLDPELLVLTVEQLTVVTVRDEPVYHMFMLQVAVVVLSRVMLPSMSKLCPAVELLIVAVVGVSAGQFVAVLIIASCAPLPTVYVPPTDPDPPHINRNWSVWTAVQPSAPNAITRYDVPWAISVDKGV